jgi:hypothetical protein
MWCNIQNLTRDINILWLVYACTASTYNNQKHENHKQAK